MRNKKKMKNPKHQNKQFITTQGRQNEFTIGISYVNVIQITLIINNSVWIPVYFWTISTQLLLFMIVTMNFLFPYSVFCTWIWSQINIYIFVYFWNNYYITRLIIGVWRFQDIHWALNLIVGICMITYN